MPIKRTKIWQAIRPISLHPNFSVARRLARAALSGTGCVCPLPSNSQKEKKTPEMDLVLSYSLFSPDILMNPSNAAVLARIDK